MKRKRIKSTAKHPTYGNKRDYRKIDIFVDGSYASTTTWARTIKQAVDQYVAKVGLDPHRVTAKRQESRTGVRSKVQKFLRSR